MSLSTERGDPSVTRFVQQSHAGLFWRHLPAQAAGAPDSRPTSPRWAELRALPHLGRANIAAGLTNGMQFALWAHLPEIVQRGFGMGVAVLGSGLVALHVGTFAGRVGWGIATDRWLQGNAARALRLLCLTALMGCVALALVVVVPALLVLACCLLGASVCAAVGLHVAVTAQIAPAPLLGGALAYTMLVTNLGGVVVPLLLGFALSVAGPVAGAATLMGLVLLTLWALHPVR